MRRKKPRTYTATDKEQKELIQDQLPYPIDGDVIDTHSGLILHALRLLPRKKR